MECCLRQLYIHVHVILDIVTREQKVEIIQYYDSAKRTLLHILCLSSCFVQSFSLVLFSLYPCDKPGFNSLCLSSCFVQSFSLVLFVLYPCDKPGFNSLPCTQNCAVFPACTFSSHSVQQNCLLNSLPHT